jgi:hypothetical protein
LAYSSIFYVPLEATKEPEIPPIIIPIIAPTGPPHVNPIAAPPEAPPIPPTTDAAAITKVLPELTKNCLVVI